MDIYTGRVLVLVGKSIYIDILLGNNLFPVLFDNEKKRNFRDIFEELKIATMHVSFKGTLTDI